ncbi:hypothetical protein PR202_ga25333 [Eleusine coracana subsp. coracana]|uniref:Cytochrome P450 71A1 n=1 Tax=Eleusine coracana subsp. coracana TaxID=191504 RepID=A0AAV5DBL5_ELECO|nr:hypothetical protein PR202_ga25333 [Eleusine coracana subsp. coracana]
MASVQLDSSLVYVILFVLSSILIVRSLRSSRKDGLRPHLPSPPALPVLGNLHQLGRGHHHRKLQALARQYGPLFLLRLGSMRALVVSSAAMAEEVLKTQDHIFCGRPQQYTARAISYDFRDIGFSSYGDRCQCKSMLGGTDPGTVCEMLDEVTVLLETIAVSDLFPQFGWVDWLTGLDSRIETTARKLDAIFERVLQEHEKSSENGIDTTSKAILWAMAELVKNPNEMEKVQAQVRQVVGAQGVLEQQLGKMSRLQAAMKEAMRLHPPVPLVIPHEVIRDTKLHVYHIPAQTRVIVNAWAIGRDSESWENAEEFLRERFMHNNIFDYSGKDIRFIPFSAGRRGCPGIAFATRLAELALANLLYHFNWELPEGQDIESFEVVESNGLSPSLKSDLILVPKLMQA